MPDMATRQSLLDQIIERELEMFLAVTNRGGTSTCQERPDTFRAMRWTSHSVLSDAFLASYLNDLKEAKEDGRNLMTEKYALMENLIPDINPDPRVDAVMDIEGAWRDALANQYPHIFQIEAGTQFRLYLSCELQTLSDKTLDLYKENVDKAVSQNRNLLQERYENLFRKMGYASLEEKEAMLAEQPAPKCPTQ